jgi:hypothetical protein
MAKAAKKKKAPAKKHSTKAGNGDLEARRATAYLHIEPHLCDVVRMGEIAASLFDSPDPGLFVFAVTYLEDMLRELRQR